MASGKSGSLRAYLTSDRFDWDTSSRPGRTGGFTLPMISRNGYAAVGAQSDGSPGQSVLGRNPRTRGRSELSGHPRRAWPAIRSHDQPTARHGLVGESATSCPCSELTSTGCGTSGPRVADRRAPVLKAYSRRAPSARPHLPISKDGRSPRSSRCLRGFQGSGSYREAHGMSDHIVDAMRAIHRAINSHMPPG
jgi:hypothetical protein